MRADSVQDDSSFKRELTMRKLIPMREDIAYSIKDVTVFLTHQRIVFWWQECATFHLYCFCLRGAHHYPCREVSLHVDTICVTIIQYIQSTFQVYIQVGIGGKEVSCSHLHPFSVTIFLLLFYPCCVSHHQLETFKTLWPRCFDTDCTACPVCPVMTGDHGPCFSPTCTSTSFTFRKGGGEWRERKRMSQLRKWKEREMRAYLCKELRQAELQRLADTRCVGVAGPGE